LLTRQGIDISLPLPLECSDLLALLLDLLALLLDLPALLRGYFYQPVDLVVVDYNRAGEGFNDSRQFRQLFFDCHPYSVGQWSGWRLVSASKCCRDFCYTWAHCLSPLLQ